MQFHSDAWSLTPTALRCDSMATSQFDVDRSCIFLNFPYFLLDKPWHRRTDEKLRDDGVRTLLQSHDNYHNSPMQENRQSINILDERLTQSINILDDKAVKKFVASPCDAQESKEDLQRCMIYVPEMWAIMSLSKARTQAATRRTNHE